jgi:FkbM family methyltransferase
MKTISYAQNAEDIRLERVFGKQATGFWVDIGAHDPVHFSMTKRFSDRGWRGVNVDASPRQLALLTAGRPADINLNVGISDMPGTLTFFEADADYAGLSTFSEADAAKHIARGFPFREVPIPVMTLDALFDEHVKGQTVDFLSIDVEGHEASVLAGLNLTRHRPRVIVVEATAPLSRSVTHGAWEHFLVDAGYLFATFDGLNRWYVRPEDAAFMVALELPMCSHDDFVPWEFQERIVALEAEVAELKKALPPVARAAQLLKDAGKELPGAINSLRNLIRRRSRRGPTAG